MKFRCRNQDCPGRLRVVRTLTKYSHITRWRKCNVCGRRVETCETVVQKNKTVVSFSELQKAARQSRNQ